MVKIFITGDDVFNDLAYMIRCLDPILENYKKEYMIVGTGKYGAESRAEVYARTNNIKYETVNPGFKYYAGLGNIQPLYDQLFEDITACIIFTKYKENALAVVPLLKNKNIKYKIIPYTSYIVWHDTEKLLFTHDRI